MNSEEKKQFKNEIKEAIQKQLGNNFEILIQEIAKVNVVLDGLTILNKEEKIAVSPQIYLNEYYKKYDLGYSISKLAAEIIEVYKINHGRHSFKVEELMNWDNVKEKVVCRLINFEKNKKLLEEVPYIKFIDLAIVFYVIIDMKTDIMASFTVTNHQLSMWNVMFDEMFELAKVNTRRLLPITLQSMKEVIKAMLMKDIVHSIPIDNEDVNLDEMIEQMADQDDVPMFVLSNKSNQNGAISIIFQDVLEEFADKHKSDLFVLPSSIHEVIIVPVTSKYEVLKFSKMVKEINETQVQEDEVLSDHVYMYQRETKQITY
jgi:hypothetical protein